MGIVRRVFYAFVFTLPTYLLLAQTTSKIEDADPFDDEQGLVVTLTLKGDGITYDARLFIACEPSNYAGPILMGGVLPTKHQGDSALDLHWRVDDHPPVTLKGRGLEYQQLGYRGFLVHSSKARLNDAALSTGLLDPKELRLRISRLWPQILTGSKLVGRLGNSRSRYVTFDLLDVREDLRAFSARCAATQQEWNETRDPKAEPSDETD